VKNTQKSSVNKNKDGTSLAVQWLRLCASTAGSTASIPGQGIKILHTAPCSKKKKKKKEREQNPGNKYMLLTKPKQNKHQQQRR